MKFTLRIDPRKDEEIIAQVKAKSELTDAIEDLVRSAGKQTDLTGYDEDGFPYSLNISGIECLLVENDKTYAVTESGRRYRIRARLYELEKQLPETFSRINKSAIANRKRIREFKAAVTGGVDVIFLSGYTDYVSRRCFAELRRRIEA